MMTFVTFEDTLKIVEQTEDRVVFEIEGSTAPKDSYGGFAEPESETMEFEVSRERAEDIASDILDG